MKIKVVRNLFDYFKKLRNIEYEINWILGYVDRKNFYSNLLYNITIKGEMIDYLVDDDIINLLMDKFPNYKEEDTERVINVLYFILYVLGGTN